MMNLIIFVVLAACWYSICWLKEELGEAKAKQIKTNEILMKQHQCMKNMAKLCSSLQTRLKSTETDVTELEKWADKIDAMYEDLGEDDDEECCSFQAHFDPDPCCCGEVTVSFSTESEDLYEAEKYAGGCDTDVEWTPIPLADPLDLDVTDPGTAAKLKETEE